MKALTWSLALAMVVASATSLSGQEIARSVDEIDDGTVRMTFATRNGVEICDQGIRFNDSRMMWHSDRWDRETEDCRTGSAEVELRVRDGRVRDVEIIRKARDRTRGAVDLGTIPADEAASYFLMVAGEGRGLEEAVFPAMLADVPDIWQDVMTLARDRGVDEDVRSSALFWVGQEAADAATEGLADVALDEDEDEDVRDAAIFALTQRPEDEYVPILMDVAMTARHAESRQSAMFWLAQSDDPRVLEFFEDILLGRSGRSRIRR